VAVSLIFDTDDLWEGHDRMDLLYKLRAANPLFRMTAFAVPSRCSDAYIDSLPDWIEVVPHGWDHGDPPVDGGEWRDWSYDQMLDLIDEIEDRSPRWARGAKAPGWVISDGCLRALADCGWWVADQRYNDDRRPAGLRVHCEGEGEHVHTHVQNVCGNGLEETFPALLARVRRATSFELVSEVVRPWVPAKVPA
jgi:hypothetical protein